MHRTLVIGLMAVLLFAAGCGQNQGAPASEPGSDDTVSRTLLVGIPDDAATFDMLFATTPRSTEVIMNTYEPLMVYGLQEGSDGLLRWDPYSVQGGALESMELGPDGLTWTLRVREGVRFPSGAALDADAVKYMFDRNFGVQGSGGAFMYQFIGAIPGPDAVRVIDERTLEVRTDAPNPLLPRIFTLSNSVPMDVELMQANSTDDDPWASSWLQRNTAGAGPYRLATWTPGVEIVLEANPSYRGDPPHIERVVMKIVPNAADRMMLLAAGELDVAERLSAEEVDSASRIQGLKVISVPSTNGLHLVMNTRTPPFDDVRVRQAISYAVPYDDIIEAVYFGRAQKAAGPVPVGFPMHDPGDYPYRYDPEKARALLEEAGYADGFAVELELDAGNPDHEAVAVHIQNALAQVGVDVTIQKLTPAVYAERRANRTMAFFLNESLWWIDHPLYPMRLGYTTDMFFNYGEYSNLEVDSLVAAAAEELDESVQHDLLAQAQHLVIVDAPLVWIAQPNFNLVVRENITGYVHYNDHMVRFATFEKH